MLPEPGPVRYRFGVFEVDVRSGELRRQGRQVRLRGRPFEILVALLAAEGAVVTREELRRRLWTAETFVDFDHGLNTAMNRLREALGDSAESPRYIETLPRRGYRFIAPAVPVPSGRPAPLSEERAPAPQPSAQPQPTSPKGSGRPLARWLAPVLVAVGVFSVLTLASYQWQRRGADVQDTIAIAVLPFANLSGDPGQEFLSDGFTEELIAELGSLHPRRFAVVARTTAMQYKERRSTVGEIGRELGVQYVLEGSVRRMGSRVRITAQFVQVADQTNLWSERFERDEADALTIQRDVAERIARTLSAQVLPGGPPGGRPAPSSFQAYEYTLRGKHFRDRATEASTRAAIDWYERAIALDPGYALAHAGLADAYRLLAAPGWEADLPSTLLGKAEAAAAQALRLAPELAEAHAAAAMVSFTRWDLPAAEAGLKRAIALNPSYAQAYQYYSAVLTAGGRLPEAVAEARRAFELDPLSRTASTTLGVRLYYAGDYEAAAERFRETLQVNPDFAVAHWGVAQTLRMQGRLAESIDAMHRAVEHFGESSYMRGWLGYHLALAGRGEEALAVLRAIEAEREQRYVPPFHLALVHAGLRDDERTLDWLEKAYDDRSGWMVYLPVENEFSHLAVHPRYVALLQRVGSGR